SLAALSLLLAGTAPGLAKAPAPPAFEDTSQVVSVEVPVNVVDRNGQPVRGLTADDFEIWDGNQKQAISSFEAVDLQALEAAHEAAGQATMQRMPEMSSSARRHFLLLFDLSFSSPTAVLKARLAARDF